MYPRNIKKALRQKIPFFFSLELKVYVEFMVIFLLC